jgi:hypothetical protein
MSGADGGIQTRTRVFLTGSCDRDLQTCGRRREAARDPLSRHAAHGGDVASLVWRSRQTGFGNAGTHDDSPNAGHVLALDPGDTRRRSGRDGCRTYRLIHCIQLLCDGVEIRD